MQSDNPAVACADGAVHVVWEDTSDGEIWYRRRSTGTWGTRDRLGWEEDHGPAGHPDVAAGSGRVFVVWDWCTDSSCDAHYLVYARSNDNGSSWYPRREVGTDYVSEVEHPFTAYGSPSSFADHRAALQPSIALTDEGWPAVAWHGDAGSEHGLYVCYSDSGGDLNVTWSALPMLLNAGREAASAVVEAIGQTSDGEPGLHITYMGKSDPVWWDVYHAYNAEPPTLTLTYLPSVVKE
jgi:hypothetical protein